MKHRCGALGTIGRALWPSRGAAVAAVCMGTLVCASGASAAPTWLSPSNLSPAGSNADRPGVAVAPDGEAIAVWSYYNGSNEIIQAAVRPASGGAWQSPVTLSEAGRNASSPRMVVAPDGEAIVVWELFDGSHQIVQASVRSEAAGAWGSPVTLSEASHDAYSPQIGLDPSGEAIAVWEFYNGSHAIAQASVRPQAGGAWQTPVDLSETDHEAYSLQLAINAKGEAIAVWAFNNGSTDIAQASVRPEGGSSWQAPIDLSETGGYASQPHIALNDEGEAVATWSLSAAEELIQTSVRLASGGSWQTPVTVGRGEFSMNFPEPQVAIDARGDAVAVWSLTESGGRETVTAAVRPSASGSWRTPVKLSSASDDAEEPQVAIDPQGETIAAWRAYNGSYTAAQVSVLASPEGSWTAVQDISEASGVVFQPEVAIDPRGDAVAVWDHDNFSESRIQASTYVVAGPTLGKLSIPAAGAVGESLSFSVEPLDAWASLGQTEWSFGDGAVEDGTSVSHGYAAPGSYEVEVRSEDVFGNVTIQKGTVVVKAPAEEEPPAKKEPVNEESPANELPGHETKAPESKTQEIATVSPADSAPATNAAGGPPVFELLTKAPQPLINAKSLVFKIKCGGSACSTSASGWIALPGHHRVWRLGGYSGAIAGNATSEVRLRVPGSLRHAVRVYLRRHPHYEVVLHLKVTFTVNGQTSHTVDAALPIWTYPGFR
jgi:hypothetical protein